MKYQNDPQGTRLPVKLDTTTNGEFAPIPLARVHHHANRLALEAATRNAKRLGIDRRSFLVSACGVASTLLGMNAAYAATGRRGGFYELPNEAALDLHAARSAVDGNEVIFGAVDLETGSPTPAPVSWLDRLLGVAVAEAAPPAHSGPSDWWMVPTEGGTPTRLTQVADTGLYGDIGPDGEHLAYLSASGLYVMGVDGTELTRLSDKGGYGTLGGVCVSVNGVIRTKGQAASVGIGSKERVGQRTGAARGAGALTNAGGAAAGSSSFCMDAWLK